jgi:hypothetical protein
VSARSDWKVFAQVFYGLTHEASVLVMGQCLCAEKSRSKRSAVVAGKRGLTYKGGLFSMTFVELSEP